MTKKFVSIGYGSLVARWIMVFEKASMMKHLCSSSITHTSSRIHWSFFTCYHVLNACRENPPWCLHPWSRAITETERRCHPTKGRRLELSFTRHMVGIRDHSVSLHAVQTDVLPEAARSDI